MAPAPLVYYSKKESRLTQKTFPHLDKAIRRAAQDIIKEVLQSVEEMKKK